MIRFRLCSCCEKFRIIRLDFYLYHLIPEGKSLENPKRIKLCGSCYKFMLNQNIIYDSVINKDPKFFVDKGKQWRLNQNEN